MGGKSSSSNEQRQETTQLSSDGVVAGDLFQGKSISINQDFPDTVAQAFDGLLNLTGEAINLAGQAGDRALTNAESAIDRVADRSEFGQAPEVKTIESYLPFFMLGMAGVSLYLITKGFK